MDFLYIDWSYWINYILIGITAVATLALLYLALRARNEGEQVRNATFSPVAEFSLNNLPPYIEDNQMTELIITNKGNCRMDMPRTKIDYSWGGPARMLLDWGFDDSLVPNESKIFHFRLPDPPLDQGEQEIIVSCICIHSIAKIPVEWEHKIKIAIGQ